MPPQQGFQQTMQQDQRGGKNSIGSNMSGSTEHADHYSEEDGKANMRGTRGKKGAAGKGAANGKRKTDETPAKPPANKKARASTQSEEPEDVDDMSPEGDEMGKDGKKMTDEEKRKNFLERNRYVECDSTHHCDICANMVTVSPPSNVDSGRSNGWPIFSKR